MEGKEIDSASDAAAQSALDMHFNNKTFNDTNKPLIADLLKIALGTMFKEINKLNSADEKKSGNQQKFILVSSKLVQKALQNN